MKKTKGGYLIARKVSERITLILKDKFYDCLSCIKKDALWCSFKIEDLIGKVPQSSNIWTQDEYAKFTGKLSRKLEMKKKVFFKLANVEEDEEKEEIFEPISQVQRQKVFFK